MLLWLSPFQVHDRKELSVLSLPEIQAEVEEWSRRNFGEQVSKATGQTLGSLAPLMGIVEENGERYAAKTEADREDAIGDTMIYLMDFANRDGMRIDELPAGNAFVSTVESIGRLFHATLKRHQGIRGFDNPETYTALRDQSCANLIARLRYRCGSERFLEIVNTAWSTVKRRDWEKNKANAAEVA